MTIFGIDVSNVNGPNVDLAQVKAEGFSFVWLKCTEGSTFRDQTWPAYRDSAKAHGLVYAAYHYLWDGDPEGQADNLLGWIGDDHCPIMVDVEANSGDINSFWAFVRAVNARGREVALSYIPRWYWQQIGSPDLSRVPGLISSAYPGGTDCASNLYTNGGGDTGGGWAPYGGAAPAIWQFTDRAMVAGKAVDANAFRGTREELAKLIGATSSTPAALPPAEPMSDHDLLADVRAQLTGGLDGYPGWPMLGGLTVVEALAAIGQKLGIPGFNPPSK